MRRVESLFVLAVQAVTSVFGDNSGDADTNTSTTTDDSSEVEMEEIDNDTELATSSPDTDRSEAPLVIETSTTSVDQSEPDVEIENPVVEELEATTTVTVPEPDLKPQEKAGSSTIDGTTEDEISVTKEPSQVSGTTTEECLEECLLHTVILSDFSFPLDAGVEVTGAQVRLSFAAKKKITREHIPAFTINYSIDNGTTWSSAGSLMIDDEVSNSVNGGYFLFALPELYDQEALDGLKVELVYKDNPAVVAGLFIESIWLELFTLEAPKDQAPSSILELLQNDGFDEEKLSGDELVLPDGKKVDFNFTDNNKDETLIIKTNESDYTGLSEVTTYFSVTNESDNTDEFSLQTYFPEDAGEVKSLEMFNQNKPRKVVIPEYRPYVYNCEAGWEYAGDFLPDSLDELSKQFSVPSMKDESLETTDNASTTKAAPVIEFSIPTSSVATTTINENEDGVVNTTTTVMNRLPNLSALLQFSATESTSVAVSSEVEETEVNQEVIGESDNIKNESITDKDANTPADDGSTVEEVFDDSFVAGYSCRNTNIVRQCDELDGANTACRVNQVKMAEHEVTQYSPGWDIAPTNDGALLRPGFLRRVAEFIGFGPDRKTVPETFEVRAHTPDTYVIEPGETKYFKMQIAFPPFTEGEYWIEAVGDSEYGLLDPFWASDWSYRMPITIDNTSGTTDLTEYQVFLEITSSLTDFWTNVQSDGSDVRFAQQVSVGNFSDAGTARNNWFDTDWGGRVPVTVPPLTASEDQSNFPVFVDLSLFDNDFWTNVKTDGGDIRVVKSDGTELAIDMVEIDTVAKTGELHFLADIIAANAANTFYVYYDNSAASLYAASDPLGSEAVWSGAGYRAVYHFKDDPTTLGNTITDETGLGYDLTVASAVGATTTGQMGTAFDFNGVSGYLENTAWTFEGGDPLITTGLYQMAAADNSAIWQWGTGVQPNDIEFRPWYNSSNGLHYFGVTSGATYNTLPQDTTDWHAFGTVGTTSTSGNNLVYEDGVLVETVPQTVSNTSNNNAAGFSVGRTGTNGWWDGLLDELRIATTTRTDERVSLETINLYEPASFYSVGSSQVPDNAANLNWYSTSWDQRLKISIPQSKIDSDLTDFPVYLDLSGLGDDFFSGVANNGSDIRITIGDGVTEVPIELVSIDTGAKTGELYFKTNLYNLSANDFYLYFDNEDAVAYSRTSTYGADNVWTNNYLAVYHLEEDVAGSGNTNVYKDSTANQYDGDDNNTSNDKTGLFGKGQEFGDDQNDHLSLPKGVLNGVSDLTTSWWHETTNSGSQGIVSAAKDNTGAGANEYITWFNNNSNFQVYYQNRAESFGLSDTITNHNTGDWNFFAVTGEEAIDEVNFYVNGVGDTENPDPQPVAPLSVANGGLVVGQEQDSLGGGFSPSQNFEGQLDELRFADVVRDPVWLATEYANMSDMTTFIATSSLEQLQITDFIELDYWIQHFDSTGKEADIWVQVADLPAGEETVIYMYYGSTGATSASDEMATFSYSTSTEIFHIVDDSGANQVSVVSLVDNNQVSLDGGTPVSLNAGERTTFTTFTGASTLSVLGPISGTVTNNSATDGSDTIVPIAFATTTHAIPTNRGTERYYVKAPFATSSVSTYIGGSGTPTETPTVNFNTVTTVSGTNPGGSQAAIFESDNPILVMQRASGGTAQDGLVSYPPTIRDLFGFHSNTLYVTALAAGSDPTAYCSGGSSGVQSGITRGETQTVTTCTSGTQFTGNSVRYTGQVSPIAAIQQADSDGNESTTFWPQMEFGTRYSMSNQAEFVAIACSPRFGDADIEIWDTTGVMVDSGTCSVSGNSPGTLRLGNPSTATNQSSTYYAAGYQVVSTNDVPFYAVYEDTTVSGGEDEKNIVGPVQARKFDGVTTREATFGAEEPATTVTYDEDFEQLSYAWYENTTSQTPTVHWPINTSEDTVEGEAISGSGAVNNGDILRLRLNMAVSNATATAQSSAFSLQYAAATGVGLCSAAVVWSDLGEVGSTTAIFAGYDNTGLPDGTTLSSTTLASSTVAATYEERNYSDFIPNEIGVGEVAEWDWVITAENVDINTAYCFRMVRATGEEMTTYTSYPELITVGPPNVPTNIAYFDNEHTTDLTPVLEFVTIDVAGDDIQYQVQVDDDVSFGSVDIDKNSTTDFLNFENITVPSDKAPFTSGNLIRFTSPTGLASSTTYWWRVRASDPSGSATTSDWSAPTSFTTNQTLQTSEWFQTTGDQFDTNSLSSLTTSAGSVSLSGVLGTMVGTAVDFDDAVIGNSWAEVDWNDTETVGEIRIQVEYNDNGSWQLVPDASIPSNSIGTSTAPINLRELDTSTFNELRLVATFDGTTLSLEDWTIRWGLRVETPTLGDLFDNQKTVDTLPVFDFVSNDPQGDELEYEISFSIDKTFAVGTSTYNSSSSPGFVNQTNGGDTTPFVSGDNITYTTQAGSPFVDGVTYWWRARAKDPNGDDSWSPWSNPDSFTVDTSITKSTWFQTTQEQFVEGSLSGTVATTSDSVIINDQVGEYGKTTVTNGTWTVVNLQSEYNNPVVVASGRYTPTGDTQRSIRVRNKEAGSFEVLADNYDSSVTGTTVVDWLVMEAGTWNIEDGSGGTQVIAGTYEDVSDVQANTYAASGYGVDVTFSPSFSSPPAVIATVSSNNDSSWVIAHLNDGNTRNNPPTASGMGLYLGRSFESAVHDPEDIDYIAFETGHGTNDGAEFDADFGNDSHNEPPVTAEAFTSSFSPSAPEVVIVMQAAEQGGNGGYAGLYAATPPTTNNYYPFIDEDGSGADRNHTAEPILALAFENSSGVLKREPGAGLSGTIAGEDIIFSDGAGPKYDNFSWSDSTPGSSDIIYQMEYQVSPGVYALIPDTEIPGNSTGTSTSPIDLTNVDIDSYPIIRPFATLTCVAGSCPQIDDWQLEWSEGVNMSGTLKEYDRLTNVATGTIRVAVNGSLLPSIGTVTAGVWTVNNVTAFNGDVVTVWVDGVDDSEEAVAVFVYDGLGDMSGIELFQQHLSISANEEATVTNADVALYDNLVSGDEDIFFNVDAFDNLVVCSVGVCSEANIYVGPGNTYIPSAAGGISVTAHDFVNDGTIELDSNVFNISGSWTNNATSTTDTSTLNMTAATGTEALSSTEVPLNFHTVSFGSGVGDATFTMSENLDLSGSLTVASGTLARDGFAINVAGNITTGTGGFWQGTATTTFDGAGAKTWRDDNPVVQKIGDVVIDGASTNVTALTDVGAYDIRIGTNDRLNGSSGNTIFVGGDWQNNGTFGAQSGTVEIINDDRTYPPVVPGSQDWYADSAFDSRLMIDVDHTEVAGNLTDFPLYVDLSTLGNDFWASVSSDGRDIRITSDDGQTELAFDLVEIDSTAKTGELHFLAPSVDSATTTTFFIYFDNPAASPYAPTDPYGSEAVWAEYKAVYHFTDDPTTVSNAIQDSTANNLDLLVEVAGLATSTGQLGLGINLIGSTGILRNAAFTWAAGDRLTTSGWYKMPSASNESLWQWGTGADPDRIEFRPWYNSTNGVHYFGVTSGATYSQTPRDTVNWIHFLTIGATSTSEDNLVYQNSIEIERLTQTVANPSNNGATGLQVGRNGTTNSLQAQIDEFRIATVFRNTDWVEAEYSNQKTPTTFYATSSVQSYVPDLIIDEATHYIDSGGSSFYNLIMNDATTSPAFTEPSVVVSGDFTVATGTVALPTGVLTVGGSFTNNSYFMHNNAEVKFTSAGPANITLNGTEFFNALYDVTFSGAGTKTFLDTNATTSNNFVVNGGSVVLPNGILTIGGFLDVNSGSFDANGGTILFSSSENEDITTKGSSFNNVIFGIDDASSGWYNSDWSDRIAIKVASTSVEGSVSDFPVYVDLSLLGDIFWTAVASDGRDIRVTSGNGKSETPVEIVEINTALETGELHFLAPALSPSADTTFYVYFNNSEAVAPASDSTYGSEAVWAKYEAVYHFNEDPVLGVTDVSGHGKDLSALVGTPSTTAGKIGVALDLTSANVMVGDSDWTWTTGEDLVSSGLYYQSAVDTGALWEFGSTCGGNDGTCLAFMPWYTGDTGYHRFGVTSGNTYSFTRNGSIWHHFTTNGRATAGETNQIFEDSILQGSVLQTAPAQNPSNTGLQLGRYTGGTYMDIQIDELRFATSTRSQNWITTEYNNLTDVSSFFSTSSEVFLDVVPSFTLNEATTDAVNDVTIYYANLVAPTVNFIIGGSALNIGGSYDANSATTTMNSTDTGETLDFGDGAFYNLSFDGVGGGWTIATTTVTNNASLVTGADFTLATNTTMTVGGIFSNTFNSAATTWSGSTLVLTGGDYIVTDKLGSGDNYANLEVLNDSDIVIWNSSITSFVVDDLSSIYMPDYSGTIGKLRIYGSYERISGTEYWNYDTDFDGTDLTGGSEREVNVEIGRGSSLYFATSTTLEAKGISTATTTVSAVSGIYSLNIDAGTLDAEYVHFQNIGPKGLYLTNGTILTNFSPVEFAVSGGRSGMTVDVATMNAQPSSGFSNTIFATSSSNGIYEASWSDQVLVTVQSSVINEETSEYPVYVDLSFLGDTFWSGVQSDGRDIRVTTNNGTELPIDLVEIDTVAKTGELYFLAPTLSQNDDTVFYLHFDNPAATAYAVTDQYGANAVWVNYEAVYHFNEDPAVGISDMTSNGRDLSPTIGTMATTSGLLGTALDTTNSNTRLENLGWTWTAGDNLISSGLYFMSAYDTGALWQFGSGSGSNNGTYLSFMPWYSSATRGYHFFGITSGGDYDFARDNSVWHHFTTIGRAGLGENNEFYEDTVLRDSVAQIVGSQNPSNVGLRIGAYQTTTYLDVDVDELRFATTTPSVNRINAEYLNFTDPSAFYATSSAPTLSYNVTTEGVPSTYWVFTDGSGNLYGEAFDNDDGDPGSIQWGDSNFTITVSGVVYSDDGVTPATTPVCNASTEVVTVVLNGVDTYKSSCNPLDGSFEVTGITYVGEPQIVTYIESGAATPQTNVTIYDETTGTSTVSGGIMTVTRPNVVDGSVLVLIAGKDDDPAITAPGGWTAINTFGDTTGDDLHTGIWYRVVADAGTEAATYDFTADSGEGYSYWMGSLLNVDNVTPVDVASAWTKLQDQSDPIASEVTTVTNGALVLAAWYSYRDTEMVTPVYGWSDRTANLVGPETNNLSVVSRSMPTAGATGDVAAGGVIYTRETHTGQFAFRPASSPTATSSMTAAAVTKTPLGSTDSPYETVTLRDQSNGYGTVAAGADVAANRPTVEDGDVLIAILGKEDDFSFTAPAGWVLGADRLEITGNDMYTGIWYKVITNAAGEPATYNFTNNDTGVEEYSYWIGSFAGVDSTNVFDVAPAWSNLQNDSSPAAPALTTVTNGAYVLAAWYVINDPAMDMPGSPWITHAQDLMEASRLMAVAGRSMSVAGNTGAATMTGGSSDDVNVGQFALRPAPVSVATSISDMDLYQDRVIVRHEDISPLAIADMVTYDNSDDSDIPFTAATGAPDLLTILSGSGLVVWNNSTFDSGGEILLSGSGSTVADGSILLNPSSALLANGTDDITIGGSLYLETGATFTGASSPVTFTSTNSGQQIGSAASSTVTMYDVAFTGAGGNWAIQTPVVSETGILVSNGTVSGVSDVTVNTGSFGGNGSVDMTGGTTRIMRANTLGGTTPWSFYNLTLGDGINTEITKPASNGTTTVRNVLTISIGHFLDAYGSIWDVQGNGNTFVETGTFIEGTSTIRYSGATPNIYRTTYYNLVVDTDNGGSVTAAAPTVGLQVLGNLTLGVNGTSTLNANSSDPLFSVGGNVHIGPLGTLEASNSNILQAYGNWDNDGSFVSNGGTVSFLKTTGSADVAAGGSDFATLNVTGAADYTFSESATATANMVLNSGGFTLSSGQSLSVGGSFTNSMDDIDTSWTGTTLNLYSGTSFLVNAKTTSDNYNNIVTADGTHPRLWNSTSTLVTTNGVSSVYSMNHEGVNGDLYIFGDYVNGGYNDHWSYASDFDGAVLGTNRQANVLVEAGGSVLYPSGSLYILGTSTASTSVAAQTAGTYNFEVSGDTEVDMSNYVIRDTTIEGIVFSGAPNVIDISNGDLEVAIVGGSTMTVGGTVITANPARNFTDIRMATTTAINAFNVTATGTSASAWRFVNVFGNLGGEAKDVDPAGDPGYITWEDSAAIINISGSVYSDEGVTVSGVCDGVTKNIWLSVHGLTFASTTCAVGTGDYIFTGIGYGLGDTLTVYIDNEAENAVTITQDPVSSISNFDLYENRVVIKHESGAPMTIADMGVWDSDDDPDILFDAETAGSDTLVLPPDTKLIVASNKQFAPGGDVTVSGGGAGAAYDGTFELQSGATFTAANGEVHTVGGSLITGVGAVFNPAQSTTTFTTSGAGRTIDTNEAGFYNLSFNGSGSWTTSDVALSVGNDLTISSGAVTLPSATTTVAGSFVNSGGSFNANNGVLELTANDSGNTVQFNNSDAAEVIFNGAGGAWTIIDTDATTTDSLTITVGTVTLPTGMLSIGEDLVVSGSVTHAGGSVRLLGTSGGNLLTLSGSDLNNLSVIAGGGDYTLTDTDAAFLGDLFIVSGGFTSGAGTVSVAGSFDATGGTFANNGGTMLFNSSDTGEFVDPGASDFYNLIFAGAGGGWTITGDATTTNNFSLTLGNSFTQSSATTLYVGGVFTNTVGGSATNWSGATLVLDSGNEYSTNLKTTSSEYYDTIIIGQNTDISSWNSVATTTSVPTNSSWYSQDHAGVDGSLYIYGDYHIATTTEYWSYATDFDGTALGGSSRAVSVAVATSSTVTVDGGVLNMIGSALGTTAVNNQGSSQYTFIVDSGTFNADEYSFRNLDVDGLQFTGVADVTSLDNGDFEQAANSTTLITLTSTTINNNASLSIVDTRFDNGGFTNGVNVSLDATSTNSWSFTGAIGNLWGEAFDVDGTDDCSSVRWDDSQCLLTEQTTYRWRNDDGGEGAAPGTWYDSNWGARQRVRVINNDLTTYTDVAVKLDVTYDTNMQTDFEDLRFTDASGTSTLSYWVERYTTGTEADVWVKIPSLPADDVLELYMYYDNTGATSNSDPSNVFNVFDDFEDNDIAEYSGDTAKLATAGTFAYGGGYGLDASPNPNDKTTDGIARTDLTVSQGEIIRFMQYIDTVAGSGDEVCTMFAVQSPVTANQNYAVCLEQFGTDRISLVRDVQNTDSTGTLLASSTISFSSGWYEVMIDWQTDNTIDVSVFDSAGNLAATTSASDSTYTSGGIGFTFWFQNGGWDSYISWPRTDTTPTTHFGAEQTDGGASWAAPQDTAVGGFAFDETARLRVGIENTGLPITNQAFRLEFTPKLTAPSCEAVSGGSFVEVPVLASCGSSAVCMTTSASTTNGDPTTDHLVTDAGPFVTGEIVTNTSNQTTNLDINQNRYTELEYAIKLTTNAVNDAYCFRVTDGGSALDSYALLPELTLAFDPILSPVSLNNGLDISLTPGTTTTITASTTVTDYNGFTDLAYATTTFYRTSVGAACTPDNNNCYVASSTACSFTDCSGNSCVLSCTADFQFHADPTDSDGGEFWYAFVEVEDQSKAMDYGTSVAVDVLTIRALDVENTIAYGTVDINENTGTYNPNVKLLNIGNEAIDVEIAGTDMTDGGVSVIPASKQLFATSTFDYTSCVSCNSLGAVGVAIDVDLAKPNAENPPVTDDIYWGIEVPFGTASHPHSGINTFTAIAD